MRTRATPPYFWLCSLPALLAALLAPCLLRAQAPGWAGAVPGSLSQASGTSITRAVATDASGNVFVTGYFTGAVAFGSTVLTSVGGNDLFVAKYVPGTGTWGWAQSGGGTGSDVGYGVAVSGTSVYVTGYLTNSTSNGSGVLLGGTGTTPGTVQVNGATSTTSTDLVLAKYTDNGTTATLGWTQVGGGTGGDLGYGVAASGSSVYVTGYLTNTTANANGVLFGGGGTTTGTVPVNGATATASADLLLAKYTDNGSTATLGWTQVGGGVSADIGYAVAASGSSVYVTGFLTNSTANATGVLFGGGGTTTGTTQVNGASSNNGNDLVLAKYTDNGATAMLGWTQVGGGLSNDYGYGVAASGSSVYVTGTIVSNTTNTLGVLFGGGGTTAGTVAVPGATSTNSYDLLLAKYTDNGTSATLNWAQAGGGTSTDYGQGVAVSGSSVYAAGYLSSSPGYAFGAVATGPLLGTTGSRAVLGRATTDGGSTGTWQAVAPAFNGGTSLTRAVATDGSGNVFVTGSFTGQVDFGSTRLSSLGGNDLFVAKYVPASGTWAWAQSGGGTGDDQGRDVAVQGSSVYVAGYFTNNTANASGVLLGGTGTTAGTTQVNGASGTSSNDLLLAKYQDNGSSASLGWTQVGGGTGDDRGYGVALGTAGSVYITGQLVNSQANATTALFGGTGTTAGTTQVNGASGTSSSDIVLAKYQDNGSSASLGWTQVGGGTGIDLANGVAVSGSSVYVTGYSTNTMANAQGVLFGGTGTTAGTAPQYGASSTSSADLVLAKYQDNGSSATLGWTQVGGGTGADQGYGLTANSSGSVYVTGFLYNTTSNANGVLFGGTGTTAGTVQVNGASPTASNDIVLARYTDQGSTATLNWTQVGGGTGDDQGRGVAVSGSSLYLASQLFNNTANAQGVLFGGTGTTAGTVQVNGASGTSSLDLVLTKYQDNGSTATLNWTQVGGGTGADVGYDVALSGQNVYAAGYVTPSATFGPTTLATPVGSSLNVLARAVDNTLAPLPVTLVAFTAAPQGSATVRLAWTTASEVSSARFEVQRSADGMAFVPLGAVAAAGSSATTRQYAYLDAAALSGPSYYRLRQVDQDGTSTYSPVQAVMLGGAGLALYPNPAPGGAALLTGATPGAPVQVLDALGRVAATATVGEGGTAALGGLAPGLYVVRVGAGRMRLAME